MNRPLPKLVPTQAWHELKQKADLLPWGNPAECDDKQPTCGLLTSEGIIRL